MSTAIERVMRQRGDLDCAHEPFMYDYYVHRKAGRMPHFDGDPDHPVDYDTIRDSLIARAERGPVFAKDMAYYVLDQILRDPFCERVTHSFLIRDPAAAILSYHRLDPDFSCEEVGIEAQWRLFDALAERTDVRPPVIMAEAVRADPEGAIGAWWRRLGLDYRADAFTWDRRETPDDWRQVEAWHGAVSDSTGITGTAGDPGELAANFAAAAATAPQLRQYLDHHRPFYDRLLDHALG